MIGAFFHDERFTRDEAGTYRGTGAIPYLALARYLRHLDELVVVGRLGSDPVNRTIASGPGVRFACLDVAPSWVPIPLRAMRRHVRAVIEKVDCAVVRLPGLIGPIACSEAERAGKPWMVEVVGDVFQALWNHGSWRGKAAAIPMHLLNRLHVARAPFALYVTRTYLQRTYPSRARQTYASDVALEPPAAEVLQERLRRIASSPPRALGLVGSLNVSYKGHSTALEAVALLAPRFPDLELRLLGGGDPRRWRARAAALGIERRVTFTGALPQGGPVLRWMDALDVALAPSLTEGLPRALVEAMSRALPAVGSRAGGIPELLAARSLHRPGDARGLARLLGELLGSAEALAMQAQRNWNIAREYGPDAIDARRETLVREFIASAAESQARRRPRPQTCQPAGAPGRPSSRGCAGRAQG